MKPEKFTPLTEESDPELNEAGIESVNFTSFEKAERLELVLDTYLHRLRQTVEEIPDHTPEKAEARGLLQQFNHTMGRKLRAVALTLSVMSPLLSAEQSMAADSDAYRDQAELDVGRAQVTLENLRERVWTDDHETAYVYFGKPGSEEQVMSLQGEAGSHTLKSSLEEQSAAARKFIEIYERETREPSKFSKERPLKQITQHNHPPHVAAEMFNIDSNQMNLENNTMVFPPSVIDMFANANTSDEIDYVGYVEEPSGTWVYDHDENNPINEVIREEKFKMISEQMIKSANGTYTIPMSLSGLVQHYTLMEDAIERVTDVSYADGIQTLAGVAQEIRLKSIQGEDVSKLINQYIEIAGGLGIKVEYYPHSTN